MAVANSLSKKKRTDMYQNAQTASYEVGGHKIELTPEIVKNYMISGDKTKVTMEEVVMFMNLCKHSGLNPWAKEAYCIKYGNEPATMVVGKEAFQKRAEANPNYDGCDAGIIVLSGDGEMVYRKGTLKLKGEELIGGYAEVYRKDRTHSVRIEVSFEEYAGRKKDGSLNAQWSKKPATMIRKVALVQALRESFPSSFGGLYSAEESGFTEIESEGIVVTQDDVSIPIEQHEETPNIMQQVNEVKQEEAVQEGQQSFF